MTPNGTNLGLSSADYLIEHASTGSTLYFSLVMAEQICKGALTFVSLSRDRRLILGPSQSPSSGRTVFDAAFCRQILESNETLSFSRDDPRFDLVRSNLAFLGDASADGFFSVPIANRESQVIGRLSFVVTAGHASLESQGLLLSALASQVGQILAGLEDRSRLESALEKQKLIFDNIPALIAYWDKDQRCRFANRAYFDWFGYTPERLYGVTMRELLGDHLYGMNAAYVHAALDGHLQNFERDLRRVVQGDLRHTQATYIPDIVNGQVQGFFVLVADVTDRKTAEIVAKKAQEEALNHSRVKSRFLANMSHEIRTPMNGLIGMIDLALGTELNGTQREYLEVANQSAEHLLSIVSDILDISKIEAGEMELVRHPFQLRETISSALSASLFQAGKKGLLTRIVVDKDVPLTLVGDAVRLRQILVNIFGNAIKFTSSGHVTLHVFTRPGEDAVYFEIEDTGIGIAPEKLGVIFEPFRQGDDSTTKSYGGTGLGLSICKQLVNLMGGHIEVESVVGRGSRFRFSIGTLEKRQSLRDQNAPGRPRVLMAENDVMSIKVQMHLLEALGCDVTHATNGRDAVDLAKAQAFDLILMDVQMPILDGIEATARIRGDASSLSKDAPIVALTANAFGDDRSRCLSAGMNLFLSKPVNKDRLAGLLSLCRQGIVNSDRSL